MSGSRGFTYDSCSSGDRLSREYVARTPASWTVGLFDGKFCYQFPSVGPFYEVLINATTGKVADCDFFCLIGTSNISDNKPEVSLRKRDYTVAGAPFNPGELIIVIDNTNVQLFLADNITTRLVASAAHGIAWDVTKLYNLRIRLRGKTLQVKVWARTAAEPNWMVTAYMVYLTFQINANGFWAVRPANASAGGARTMYFSDLRVTPIRKVGGP